MAQPLEPHQTEPPTRVAGVEVVEVTELAEEREVLELLSSSIQTAKQFLTPAVG